MTMNEDLQGRRLRTENGTWSSNFCAVTPAWGLGGPRQRVKRNHMRRNLAFAFRSLIGTCLVLCRRKLTHSKAGFVRSNVRSPRHDGLSGVGERFVMSFRGAGRRDRMLSGCTVLPYRGPADSPMQTVEYIRSSGVCEKGSRDIGPLRFPCP